MADPLAASQGTDRDRHRADHGRYFRVELRRGTSAWIGQIAKRSNAEGPAGRVNRQHTTSWRAPRMLSAEQEEALRRALTGTAPEGGQALELPGGGGLEWVRRWQRRSGVRWQCSGGGSTCSASSSAGRRRGPATRWPTPRSKRSAKKVRPLVSAGATTHPSAFPQATVELWATASPDEHRIGLKPLVRRVWAPIGQRPTAVVRHRFCWRSRVGFVHPASGRTLVPLPTSVRIARFAVERAECARVVGVGPQQPIVLVLDRAGGHTSRRLRVPDHLHRLFLPPYSPAHLGPSTSGRAPRAEHLGPSTAWAFWPLTNDALVNRHFASIEEREDAQLAHCAALQRQPDRICSTTRLHWWPKQIHKRRGPRRN